MWDPSWVFPPRGDTERCLSRGDRKTWSSSRCSHPGQIIEEIHLSVWALTQTFYSLFHQELQLWVTSADLYFRIQQCLQAANICWTFTVCSTEACWIRLCWMKVNVDFDRQLLQKLNFSLPAVGWSVWLISQKEMYPYLSLFMFVLCFYFISFFSSVFLVDI